MSFRRQQIEVTVHSGEIWWLNPMWTVPLMALAVVSAAYYLPETVYRMFWRTPKYFGVETVQLCAAFVGMFVAGSFAGNLRTRKVGLEGRGTWADGLPWPLLIKAFQWCFWLSIFGYAVWAGAAVARGATLSLALGILSGDKGAAEVMKDVYLVTISGVTTLTQLGLTAMVLAVLIGVTQGWKKVRWHIAALYGLAVIRALMNSERLAIIELTIPLLVLLIRLLVLDSPMVVAKLGWWIPAAPVVGAVLLVGLFAGSEYFRSWLNFYAGGDLGFWTFVTLRLLGYYVTALNNGALLIDRVEPSGAPYFTFPALWRFPGTSGVVNDIYPNLLIASEEHAPIESLLTTAANYEFNNLDGYLVPALDYGVAGALVFWLAAGLVCGFLYRSFSRKMPLGLLMYPVVFVGVVEMPRILYWGAGRVVPAFAVLLWLAYCCRGRRQRALAERAAFQEELDA